MAATYYVLHVGAPSGPRDATPSSDADMDHEEEDEAEEELHPRSQPSFILKWQELRKVAKRLLKYMSDLDKLKAALDRHNTAVKRAAYDDCREKYDSDMRKFCASVGQDYEDCRDARWGKVANAMAFDARMKILLQVCRRWWYCSSFK